MLASRQIAVSVTFAGVVGQDDGMRSVVNETLRLLIANADRFENATLRPPSAAPYGHGRGGQRIAALHQRHPGGIAGRRRRDQIHR